MILAMLCVSTLTFFIMSLTNNQIFKAILPEVSSANLIFKLDIVSSDAICRTNTLLLCLVQQQTQHLFAGTELAALFDKLLYWSRSSVDRLRTCMHLAY